MATLQEYGGDDHERRGSARTGSDRDGLHSTRRREIVEWLLLLGLLILPLQAAGTFELVYTIAPSYLVFGLAMACGVPELVDGVGRLPRRVLAAGALVLAVYLAMLLFGDYLTVSSQARGGRLRALVYTGYVVFGVLLVCLVVGVGTRAFSGAP